MSSDDSMVTTMHAAVENLHFEFSKFSSFHCFERLMDWYSVVLFQNLPSFGPYLAKRQEVKDKLYKEKDLLSEKNMPEPQRPANAPKKPVPRVKVSHPNKSLLTKALTYMWRKSFSIANVIYKLQEIEFIKSILVC